nr:RNA-directed DNA polymerase, eukaryota [Tanacetum cinerariifolium]
MMKQNKNLMDINIDALYNILKQNQGDVNDAMGFKKKPIMVTSDPLALIAEKTKVSKSKEKSANKKQEFVKIDTKKVEKKDDEKKRDISRVKCYNCKKEGHFAKDCKKARVKDYEYYKTKMLLAKKDKDEQIEKVLSDSEASSSSANEKISEVSYYLSKSESESEYETSEYYDNTTNYDQEINANMIFMAQIEKVLSDSEASSSSADEKISEEKYAKLEAERYEYMIRYSTYFDNDKQHRKQIADQQVLYDKMSV